MTSNEDLPDAPDWKPSRVPLMWLSRHPSFWILCASPPLIVVALLLGATMLEASQLESRHGRYLKWLEKAYQQDDLSAASRYFRKLQRYDYSQNENAQFIRALLLIRSGLKNDGELALDAVAPDTRQGFRPAHLWKARDLVARTAEATPEELKNARHHLECALGMDESDGWVRTQLGLVCVAQNDYRSAAENIGLVVSEQPELYVMLAAIHKEMGNVESQISAMEKARDFYSIRVVEAPTDAQQRLTLAILHNQLGQRNEAVKTLREGIQQTPRDSTLRAALAEIRIGEFDELRQQNADFSDQLKILETTLELAPGSPIVLDRLQKLLSGDDEEVRESERLLRENLASGKAVETIHFIFGVQAAGKGDAEQAEFHFRQSYDRADESRKSQVSVLLNNLAWLKMEQAGDFRNAMDLIEQAIKLVSAEDPRTPFLRETRGQIHLRLENWSDAIKDLEFALIGLPAGERSLTHKALMTAYQRTGRTELAEEHRRLMATAEKKQVENAAAKDDGTP